jgi:hypothetical protein
VCPFAGYPIRAFFNSFKVFVNNFTTTTTYNRPIYEIIMTEQQNKHVKCNNIVRSNFLQPFFMALK